MLKGREIGDKTEGVISVMSKEDKAFKDREELKKDIRLCAGMGQIFSIGSLIFALLGVVANALSMTLGLDSMSWFLLAIVFGLAALIPNMRSLTGLILSSMESEGKKE